MKRIVFSVLTVLAGVCVLWLPGVLNAMSAQDILAEVSKRALSGDFRVALRVKTFKGQKVVSTHSMWLMARKRPGGQDFFLDFEEPEESKGLRFLFRTGENEESTAYMFIPATKTTLPLALDDPTADIGGTGLTMADLQAFIPKKGEFATLVKEEKVGKRDCYVIKTTLPEKAGHRLLWISKNDYLVLKSENIDPAGKVRRIFRVVEFFKTDDGKEFPRDEEVLIPGKNTRIRIRQENAVFGIEIPEELTDPKTFGTFKWKL